MATPAPRLPNSDDSPDFTKDKLRRKASGELKAGQRKSSSLAPGGKVSNSLEDAKKSKGSFTGAPMPKNEPLDDEDVKTLQTLECFHGYLPREDLPPLLKNVGDYLLRVSETEQESKEGDGLRMKELVLSVKIDRGGSASKPEPTASNTATALQQEEEDLVKNTIIGKSEGSYFIKPKRKFASVRELVDYHKTTTTKLGSGSSFVLKNAIPQQKWEFKHGDVRLLNQPLGSGCYGIVQKGELTTKKGKAVPVAIKSTKAVNLSKQQIKELMREARLARNFKNPNLVRTYGVAVDCQPLYILLEFVDGGSLDKLLQKKADILTGDDRLSMTLGAARGLAYLHKHDTVHCDVAARNCLISEAMVVKISDLGLAAPAKADEFHSKASMKLAIKWLAPETLDDLKFSHKTDVYSFGVLAYEIFASSEPYKGKSNAEARMIIKEGSGFDIPHPCPKKLQTFFKERVFHKDAKLRPTMEETVVALTSNGAKDAVDPKKK